MSAPAAAGRPARVNEVAAWICFLVLIPLAAHFLFSWMGFTPTDEGFTLAQSRRILDGQVPHRHYIMVRPFFTPLVHSPEVIFGGDYTFWLSRMVVWFQFGCIAAAWVAVANRIMERRLAVAAGIFTALICFAAAAHTKHITAWPTIDGIFFASLGLVLIINRPQAVKLAGYFLIGLSPLCKQNFIFMLPGVLFILGDWRSARCWLAAAAPGMFYIVYLLATGSLGDAVGQFTSHTEFFSAGILSYCNMAVPFAAVIGFAGMQVLNTPGSRGAAREPERRGLALFLLFYLPLAGTALSLWQGSMRAYAFWLFGLLVGAALALPWKNPASTPARRMALLALLLAWSASISGGYNNPALGSGAMLVALVAITFEKFRDTGARTRAYSLPVLSLVIVLCFGVGRARHIYREQPAAQLTERLDGVISGAKGIYTNRNTADFLRDLNDAVDFVKKRHKQYAIIPDAAAYWVRSPQRNPYPGVWPLAYELQTPALMNRYIAGMDARRGDTIVITQKVAADRLTEGFVPLNYFEVVEHARTHFHKVYENRSFELYE